MSRFSPSTRLMIATYAKERYPAQSSHAIAEELKAKGITISAPSILQYLRAAGVEIASHGGRREPRSARPVGQGAPLRQSERDLIIAIGKEMLPEATLNRLRSELARRGLSISITTILKVLNEAGIERGPRYRPKPKIAQPEREKSPRVAAYDAMCRRCRVKTSDAQGFLVAAAKAASGGAPTARQIARLEKARAYVAQAADEHAACATCAVAEGDMGTVTS